MCAGRMKDSWCQNPCSSEALLGTRATVHTHPFNSPFSGTTQVSRYQKGKTNLDFTEARDSEWQWHQLGHMQVCTSLQTDNHASTPLLSFLQAGCPSCRPTNSVKALKTSYSALDLIQFRSPFQIFFEKDSHRAGQSVSRNVFFLLVNFHKIEPTFDLQP